MRNEFIVHILNDEGIAKASELGEAFSTLLDTVERLLPTPSRERSLVVTELEKASYFAKRALAMRPENQR